MFTAFNHDVVYVRISFFLEAEYYSIVRMDHTLFTQTFVEGHLGCFHLLITVSYGAMNSHAQHEGS